MARSKLTDLGLLLLRTTGGLMATHGWSKLARAVSSEAAEQEKWAKFVEGVGYLGFPEPKVFAWAALLSELVGGVLVLLGIYPRIAAATIAFTMFVAAFIRHWEDSFDVKEKALLYLAAMLAIVFVGGGRWSVDQAWRRKK